MGYCLKPPVGSLEASSEQPAYIDSQAFAASIAPSKLQPISSQGQLATSRVDT